MKLAPIEKDITAVFPIPDDPDKAKVTVRLLSPGEVEDIREQANIMEYSGPAAGLVVRHSSRKDNRSTYMAALAGWENIFDDEAGKVPLPVTEENKARLADKVPGFQTFVLDCWRKLNDEHAGREISLEKN